VTLTEYGNVARIISIRLLFWESRKYFGLERKEDQVIDYKRRSVSTEVAMKWLNPNIAD
jgi:hypothetical protein